MMMMTPHQTIRLDSNNQCNTDRLNENQIDQHEQYSTADLNKKHLTRNLLSKSDKNMPATFGYQAKNVQDWTVEDVAEWLNFNNFGSYVDLFCDQHKIDGQVLITLDADDLRSEPLKLTILGDIKRFCLAFEQLKSSMNKNMNSKFQSNCNVLKQSHTTSHHSTQQNLNHVNHDQRAVPTNPCGPKSSSSESRCSSNGFNQQDTSNDVEDPYTDEEVERIRQDKGFDNTAISNDNVDLSSSSRSSSSSMTSDSSSFESRYEDENMPQSLINPSKSNEIQNHRPLRIISQTITQQELAHLVSSTHSNHSYHQTMVNKPIAVNSSEELLRPSQQKNPGVYYKEQRYRSHHHRHHHHRRHHHNRKEFKPEAWKAIVALIYIFASTWVTAIVMVIVHDRVPDMDTYPPLPDLILDNLPLIPWAFSMAETCGLILFIIWALILIFHKHRFILIRRMFSLFGSVFLIRCFTMLITSLSVPGRHLQCKARPYGTWSERLYQAYIIWQGGGMAIQGVRTCGDYMFSGHTVVLTMLNFFITEYTPPGLYLIHTMSWVLNLFGVFFILAAHEHYSIDVFIAFYISTRLFLYYHTLANNRALYQSDRRRTRVWFPLFYFFESGVPGIVPNEYEIPFRNTKDRLFKYLSSKIRRIAWIRLILDDVWQSDDYKTNDADVPVGGYVKIKNQ